MFRPRSRPRNISPILSWNTWLCCWRRELGRRWSGLPGWACCPCDQDPDKHREIEQKWRKATYGTFIPESLFLCTVRIVWAEVKTHFFFLVLFFPLPVILIHLCSVKVNQTKWHCEILQHSWLNWTKSAGLSWCEGTQLWMDGKMVELSTGWEPKSSSSVLSISTNVSCHWWWWVKTSTRICTCSTNFIKYALDTCELG